MSSMRTIPKTEWRSFFDRMSHALLGQRAEIEVASLELGDAIVAEWVPMIGITTTRGMTSSTSHSTAPII